jgi:hypothetical protein
LTEEQLHEIAKQNGVGELYTHLMVNLTPLFDRRRTTLTTLSFRGVFEGKRKTIFSLVPGESDSVKGVKFRIYTARLSEYFTLTEEEAVSVLPQNRREWKYYENAPPEYWGFEGFFMNFNEANRFLNELQKHK